MSTPFLNNRMAVGCGYPDTAQNNVTESLTYVLKISLSFNVYVSRFNAVSDIDGLSTEEKDFGYMLCSKKCKFEIEYLGLGQQFNNKAYSIIH